MAVKILRPEFMENAELVQRFKNESKAISILDHPHIVKVYDVSVSDKIQYIVMEYIDGITLKEYLNQRGGPLTWKEAVHFITQILETLDHAHSKGVVHRDIKPQNIMLLADGSIKVMDFGIARFSRAESQVVSEKAIGSVHYISPEQARGEVTDGKTDIYSVGVMLYENAGRQAALHLRQRRVGGHQADFRYPHPAGRGGAPGAGRPAGHYRPRHGQGPGRPLSQRPGHAPWTWRSSNRTPASGLSTNI